MTRWPTAVCYGPCKFDHVEAVVIRPEPFGPPLAVHGFAFIAAARLYARQTKAGGIWRVKDRPS